MGEAERVALRLGLHTGEPVVGGGGDALFGAAVVVARRLCDRSEADGTDEQAVSQRDSIGQPGERLPQSQLSFRQG